MVDLHLLSLACKEHPIARGRTRMVSGRDAALYGLGRGCGAAGQLLAVLEDCFFLLLFPVQGLSPEVNVYASFYFST